MDVVMLKLIGFGSGHAYIILKDTWPKNGGDDVLRTPAFLYFSFFDFLIIFRKRFVDNYWYNFA